MNIDELLQSERRRGGFSEEERAGMWQGIERTVAGAGAAAAGAAAAPAAKPAVAKAAAGKIATWKLGAMLAAAAIGGVAIGVAGHARWGEPRIVQVERPSPPPPIATIATIAVPVPAVPEIQTAKPIETQAPSATQAPREIAHHPPAPSTAAPPPKDPSLARERTLLDMARTALTRGDAPAALASLDTHAREFPSSQFGPEREVLAIQALASANRTVEARRRAAAFRASYPKSPLLPIVDEATKATKTMEPSEASE